MKVLKEYHLKFFFDGVILTLGSISSRFVRPRSWEEDLKTGLPQTAENRAYLNIRYNQKRNSKIFMKNNFQSIFHS